MSLTERACLRGAGLPRPATRRRRWSHDRLPVDSSTEVGRLVPNADASACWSVPAAAATVIFYREALRIVGALLRRSRIRDPLVGCDSSRPSISPIPAS